MRHGFLFLGASFAAIALLSRPAIASPTLSGDVDVGHAVGEAADWNGATFGMTARAGYEVNLGKGLFLAPEAGVGFLHIAQGDGVADGSAILPSNPSVFRLLGGLRLGVGERIVPSLFVRGGYAWITGESDGHTRAAQAPLMDVGVAVDAAVTPLFRLGGHAGFDAMWAREYGGAFTSLHLGFTGTLVFDAHDGRSPEMTAAR
ncbi:hypothetical protein [Sorangium sp. So ce385]|uniref:hypothetical protein n=1 Tax=Sorangium sp. So ce385 TaxID=3133308 RepID=UPI003F5BC7A7